METMTEAEIATYALERAQRGISLDTPIEEVLDRAEKIASWLRCQINPCAPAP